MWKDDIVFTNERGGAKGSVECLLFNDSTSMIAIEQFSIKKSKHKTILFHFHCFVCFIFIINVIANYRKLQGKPTKLCMCICGILKKSWWWKQNPGKYTIPIQAVFCFYCIKRRFFQKITEKQECCFFWFCLISSSWLLCSQGNEGHSPGYFPFNR